MLLGTLDMMILKNPSAGPAHGHTIARVIEKSSDEVLQVANTDRFIRRSIEERNTTA